MRQKNGIYNLYGRIVTKKAKGCSFYYEFLNAKTKNDGWIQPKIKLEAEMIRFDNEFEYDSEDYLRFVREIIKMPYLNRFKQFLLHLMRNNLLLGKRIEKVENPEESKCYICNEHKETRVLPFLMCKKVQKMLQFLKRVLTKAGLLKNGSEMSLFFLHATI